ncbi:hypothetical protein V5N11_031457 [Cardamine amara subsp. amara]|uniref:Uncharacterized protein n=1 Tax=Cardamine amara subsp. amara TaxID=228776 RepID=A0ABD0ZJ00_CARAN
MEKSISAEPGYSDSTSPISEPPDLANWFSSYVYESLPLSSSINESENEVDTKKLDLGVTVSNKDLNKPMSKKMNQISDSYESFPSEPPDLGNWFSSYVYESPMLDTSDGLELLVPGESECIKEMGTNKETTKVDKNEVPRLFEQELVSSTKVTDFSQLESGLSEPPDLRIWFSSYEYQSPELSDTHELGLIIEESDTEEATSCGIFRKTKSKQEETIALGKLNSNGCKENIAADMAKEVSSDNAYSDQEMEKQFSVGLFNASTKEVKQESTFKQELLLNETKQESSFSPRVSRYNPKHQSLSKNEDSLHELRPKHIQETISMNSNRQKSPINQESDDKENTHGQSTETGFVTMKKARFREAGDRCSMKKPNTGVLVECSRSQELKKIAGEEDKEERKKKRKVLEEMSNHQFSGAEEIIGKWRCPQKNKGNIVPPLKQLRLDAWIHKV